MSRDDHNKGQEDAAEGKYDPPYRMADEWLDFFTPTSSTEDMEKGYERNKDYDKGYKHTKNQ